MTLSKKTQDTKFTETLEAESFNTNADPSHKEHYSNEELISSEPIEGTPFTAIRWENNWFLTIGKYRLTENLASLEQCKEEAKDASWFRIMQIVNIMIKEHEQEKINILNTTKN